MGLTLEEANRILRGTLAKAQELNIKISAAICDPGGRPIALQRMDNTMWASAYAAQGKAVVSAAFGRPSGEMAERARAPAGSAVAPASRTKTAPAPASRNCSGSRRPTARSSAVCSTRPAHGDIAGISSGLAICKPRPFWREITRRKPDRMKLSDGEADRRSPDQRSLGRLRHLIF